MLFFKKIKNYFEEELAKQSSAPKNKNKKQKTNTTQQTLHSLFLILSNNLLEIGPQSSSQKVSPLNIQISL